MAKNSKYNYIYAPGHPSAVKNYVKEHRIVVEDFIGRYLEDYEVVHHINEDKKDNRIENLMVFQSQSAHQSWHNRLTQFGLTNWMKRLQDNRWDVLRKIDNKFGRKRVR